MTQEESTPNADGYIRFDPRVFINPPFVKCPKCGAEMFGIISIADHQYSRRCKECLFPRWPERHPPTPLPPLDKKMIYLDQFALSEMMNALNPKSKGFRKSPHSGFYHSLFERLDSLCKMQLIMCPASETMADESLASRNPEELKKLYSLLGHGASFKSSDTIRSFQIHEALGNWMNGSDAGMSVYTADRLLDGDRTAWNDRLIVSVNIDLGQEFIEDLRKHRDLIPEAIKPIFERWRSETSRGFQDWFEESVGGIRERYIEGLISQMKSMFLTELNHAQTGQLSREDALRYGFQSHESATMMQMRQRLIQPEQSDDEWLRKSGEFLRSEYFAKIAFVRIESLLWAAVAHQAAHGGRKEAPNRGFMNDVEFISTLYPYCDALFVDRWCHELLKQGPVRKHLDNYGTKIFSLANKDEFLHFLDEIRNSASEEHIRTLEEVYGKDYARPYTSLFETDEEPNKASDDENSAPE